MTRADDKRALLAGDARCELACGVFGSLVELDLRPAGEVGASVPIPPSV